MPRVEGRRDGRVRGYVTRRHWRHESRPEHLLTCCSEVAVPKGEYVLGPPTAQGVNRLSQGLGAGIPYQPS